MTEIPGALPRPSEQALRKQVHRPELEWEEPVHLFGLGPLNRPHRPPYNPGLRRIHDCSWVSRGLTRWLESKQLLR